uniref:Uncharacterized protein n=1 Tax=Anguilla anguilla TaxID=7936 RepID=A0A0E9SZ88_ANGAN
MSLTTSKWRIILRSQSCCGRLIRWWPVR